MDGRDTVVVSVIMPTFNRCHLLRESLESVLNQEADFHYEVIIVDDGSTDGTAEMIKREFADAKNIKYYYQNNSGVSVARNRGIKLALGKYIAFIDSDDIWVKTKMRNQVRYLNNNPACSLVAGMSSYIDANGNQLETIEGCSEYISYTDLCIYTAIPGAMSNIMVRRSTIEEVGGFRQDLRFGEGREFLARVAKKNKIYCLQTVTVFIRIHDEVRHEFSIEKLLQNRLVINRLIDNKKIRNKALSLTYYRVSIRYLVAKQWIKSIKMIMLSLFYCPWRIHTKINRMREAYYVLCRMLSLRN